MTVPVSIIASSVPGVAATLLAKAVVEALLESDRPINAWLRFKLTYLGVDLDLDAGFDVGARPKA